MPFFAGQCHVLALCNRAVPLRCWKQGWGWCMLHAISSTKHVPFDDCNVGTPRLVNWRIEENLDDLKWPWTGRWICPNHPPLESVSSCLYICSCHHWNTRAPSVSQYNSQPLEQRSATQTHSRARSRVHREVAGQTEKNANACKNQYLFYTYVYI